ncbi:MAG: hypothetical protein R2715_04135 [Ilumatobacteraceae bacterium]
MNDFDDHLRTELGAAASRQQLPSRGLAAIMNDGRHRSEQRTARLAIGGVAAAVALVIGSVTYLTRPDSSTVSTGVADDSGVPSDDAPAGGPDSGSVPSAPGSSFSLTGSSLTWNSVEVGSSEALTFGTRPGVRLDDGSYLQVSSAPGPAMTPRRTLWRSDNGLAWTQAGELPVSALMGSGLVAGADSRLYAVGTAPGEAAAGQGTGGDPVAVVSSDSGATWDQVDIPFDSAAIEASRGVSNMLVQMWVADGPAGTIVAVQPFAYPDLSELIEGATRETPYMITATGLELLSDEMTCGDGPTATSTPDETTTVVCSNQPVEGASYRWEDLPIDTEALPYFGGRRILLYRMADDGTLETLAPIEVDEWTNVNSVRGSATGYLVTGNHFADDGIGIVTFTAVSTDATTWTLRDDPFTNDRRDPELWGDVLTSLSYDQAGESFVSTFDPTTSAWSQTPLRPLLDQLGDGSTVLGVDGYAFVNQLAAGDEGVSLLVSYTTGSEAEAMAAERGIATTTPGTVPPGAATTVPGSPTATTYLVLRSTDLQTWSVEQLPELASLGTENAVRLLSLDGKVTVEVKRYRTDDATMDTTSATTFLIGTPTG